MVVDVGVDTLLCNLLIPIDHRDELDRRVGRWENNYGIADAVLTVTVGVDGEQRVATFGFGDGKGADGGAVRVQQCDHFGIVDPWVDSENIDEIEYVDVVSVARFELGLNERGDVLLAKVSTQHGKRCCCSRCGGGGSRDGTRRRACDRRGRSSTGSAGGLGKKSVADISVAAGN